MDAKSFLDQLLESGKKLAEQGLQQGAEIATQGKELAQQGIEYAQDKMPPPGPERDALLAKLGIGAAAAGVLGLLVGTKSGRKVLSPILKVGSVAALGGLAYKLYSDWQAEQGNQAPSQSIEQLAIEDGNSRSELLIRAMISAAKADRDIDAAESNVITKAIENSSLEKSATQFLMAEVPKPVDVQSIASEVRTPEAAVEVYLASLLVTGEQSESERAYLNDLASALGLDAELVKQLEAQTLSGEGI